MPPDMTHTAYDDAPLSSAKKPDVAHSDESLPNKDGSTLVGRTVTINKPRAEVFAFWRDFQNLPRFMENIEKVDVTDERRSHWVVSAPAGRTVEWDAIITEEEPDRLIAWKSGEGADVDHSGRIEFRDNSAGRGTEVTATILYDPPGGSLGKLAAKLFQKDPMTQARRDLRRFKQLMETGEVSTAKPPHAAPRG
jgi:uncharacterized membrane protein